MTSPVTGPEARRRARQERFAKVRRTMLAGHVEVLLCSLGADLPWLSGYQAMPLERPTVLVLPADAEATLVVPALEAPRVEQDASLFALRPWYDGEDPIAIIAELIGARVSVAISDRAWASLVVPLQHALSGVSWHLGSAITGPLRAVKDEREVAALRAAGAAADRVATQLLAAEIPLVGRTEAEVSADLGRRLIAEGHAKVNFAIVGSGPNAASPHHEPGERRIAAGETVVCDFGGTYHLDGDIGYCSDITRTVVTGTPSEEITDLYDVLELAQRSAVAAVRIDIACQELDRVGRSIITAAGYGDAFVHRIGHGIGIEEHEDPYIVEGNATPLVAGHSFSIEPGIYLSGRCGARIEDIVVATEEGPLCCNSADHALHVVE